MAKIIKSKKIDSKFPLLDSKTPFAVKEAFSLLRTNILYMPAADDNARIIAFTSAEEGTGKSTIIANTALSFARTAKKVALIDADMRCPRQHKFFGYDKNSLGLSEYLAGISTKDEVVIKNAYEELDIIPSGHIPPSPSELVLSARFEQLLNELRTEYDFIFIDFPPIGIVSDAAAVSNFISGYMFVIRANHSDSASVKESIQKLENLDANIIGTIFNDINYKEAGYRSRYSTTSYKKYESSKYAHQPQSKDSN